MAKSEGESKIFAKPRSVKTYTRAQVVEAWRLAAVSRPELAFVPGGDLPEGVLAFLGLEEVKNLYRRKAR